MCLGGHRAKELSFGKGPWEDPGCLLILVLGLCLPPSVSICAVPELSAFSHLGVCSRGIHDSDTGLQSAAYACPVSVRGPQEDRPRASLARSPQVTPPPRTAIEALCLQEAAQSGALGNRYAID